MDVNLIYDKMIQKLNGSNNQKTIEDLENLVAHGSTGSEVLLATGFYLANLKCNNPDTYDLIKAEIIAYLNYCKENGLIIK